MPSPNAETAIGEYCRGCGCPCLQGQECEWRGEQTPMPPDHRAATMGCVGTGDATTYQCGDLVDLGLRGFGFWHSGGFVPIARMCPPPGTRCTADDAVRAREGGAA